MDIAKNILVRITGIEFDPIELLNLDRTLVLISDYQKELEINSSLKKDIIDFIYECIQCEESKEVQNVLLKLKRDIFNNRQYNSDMLAKPNNQAIISRIEKLKLSDLSLVDLYSAVQQSFDREYHSTKVALKKLSQHPSFENGIILSSTVLAESSKRYLSPNANRKREAKTELGLTSYISRIITKTSPFSSFTNLGLARIHEGKGPVNFKIFQELKSKISLNNYLLKSIISILKQSQLLYKDMPVVLNQTIDLKEDKLIFITNSNNSEAFQTINNNELISVLRNIFQQNPKLTINKISAIIADEFELDKNSLHAFLSQLMTFGFLEFDLNVSGADEKWVDKLLQMLEGIPEVNGFYNILRNSFAKIEIHRSLYEDADPDRRIKILSDLNHDVSELFEHLKNLYLAPVQSENSHEQENSESSELFRHHNPIYMGLKREKLIFEDTLRKSEILINDKAVSEIVSKLDRFMDNFHFLNPHKKDQERIKALYKKNYPGLEHVPLLDFYSEYQKNKDDYPKATQQPQEFFEGFQKKIFSLINDMKLMDPHLINFNTAAFLSDAPDTKACSIGAFLQFFINKNNELGCIVNGIFVGHNKLFGRFITLFDEPTQTDILAWSRESDDSDILAENCDSTYFNANIHPELLNYEINMPGSQNTYPENKRISVKDLSIRYLPETDSIELIHTVFEKRINIYDLGFQSMKGRSGLYSFLNKLDTPATPLPFAYFSSIVNKKLTQTVNNCRILPRIVLDEKVVIQRRAWHIDNTALLKIVALNGTELFMAVNSWRLSLYLPDQVFFQFNIKKSTASDDRKPQYLDFRSPLLINLFAKKVQKADGQLIIQEMLPNSKQLFSSDGEKYVSEYLVQWKKSK